MKEIREHYAAEAKRDFNEFVHQLKYGNVGLPQDRIVAALLVVAMRVHALEDTLTTGLPTAGEGI